MIDIPCLPPRTQTTYTVHSFTTVGPASFVVNANSNITFVEVLVVAGGGAGGFSIAAGGGAGGVVYQARAVYG
jgi:hypothetical protein